VAREASFMKREPDGLFHEVRAPFGSSGPLNGHNRLNGLNGFTRFTNDE